MGSNKLLLMLATSIIKADQNSQCAIRVSGLLHLAFILFSNYWHSTSPCNQQDFHNLLFSITRRHSNEVSMQIVLLSLCFLEFVVAVSLQTMVLSSGPFGDGSVVLWVYV